MHFKKKRQKKQFSPQPKAFLHSSHNPPVSSSEVQVPHAEQTHALNFLGCGQFCFDEFSSPTGFKKAKKKNLALTKIDDAVLNERPRSADETGANPAPALEVQCFINADMHMPKCQ